MNRYRYSGLVFLCAILGSSAFGQAPLAQGPIPNPPISPWAKTDFAIATAEKPPKIDGMLDDECWKNATHAEAFFRFQSNEPVHEQTEAWICADRTHIYVAFHCQDSHPELIRSSETQREGDLSHDDQVIFAIDTQGTRRNVSQFNVSAKGTQQTQLEGGTADNLTWAGDWKAATHRVADGWTAEISIPFSILRYPNGTKAFGIVLLRQLARETSAEAWPYIPPEGSNNPMPFLHTFAGVAPPTFTPKMLLLPYVLGGAGASNTVHAGLDLKYPVSTTLTGVGTLFPDFETVEDAVTNLSFSYTEKFVPDRRPFFVEGSNLLQDSFLFYSQRIPFVDEGAKLVGKQGNTTISALATNTSQAGGQTAVMANMAQDIGLYSQVNAAVLSDNAGGQPSNQLARVGGQFGFAQGSRVNQIQGNVTEAFLDGAAPQHNDWVQASSNAGHGKLGANAYYTETDPGFVNQLGLVQETNLHGGGFSVFQFDNLDRGRLESYQVNLNANSYRHITGGFFHDDVGINTSWGMRSGLAYEFDLDAGKYEPFVDNTVTTAVSWNQKTLFHRGTLSLQVGRREDQPYQFLSFSQGFLVSKPFSVQLSFGYEKQDGTPNTQTIMSGSYRLNSQETIGGRILQQNGDVDLYLSYGRRAIRGSDVFILVGDPNSARTKGQVIVKMVWPI